MNKLSIVILAAGKGKRMNNPDQSKVMADLAGKPLIKYVLETAQALNPVGMYLIVGHRKEAVIEYVNGLDFSNINYAEQNEQLGTGHAVNMTAPMLSGFDGDVLILCGDVPLLRPETLEEFISDHKKNKADVTVLSTMAPEPKGYGRIIRDENGNFLRITEEKDASDTEKQIKEINSGVYIIKASLLFESLKQVSNNNAQGEYYLTDIIGILRSKGYSVLASACAEFDETLGINSPDDLLNAEKSLLKYRN